MPRRLRRLGPYVRSRADPRFDVRRVPSTGRRCEPSTSQLVVLRGSSFGQDGSNPSRVTVSDTDSALRAVS